MYLQSDFHGKILPQNYGTWPEYVISMHGSLKFIEMSGENKVIDREQRREILSFGKGANHIACQRPKAPRTNLRNRDKQHERHKYGFVVENKQGKSSLLQNTPYFSLAVS